MKRTEPIIDTPCPFLSRRGWCIKENNCDFKHPEPLHLNEPLNNVPKHRVRCPFVYRRGYCLKGDQCDFLHDIPSPQSPVMNQNGRVCPGLFIPPSKADGAKFATISEESKYANSLKSSYDHMVDLPRPKTTNGSN